MSNEVVERPPREALCAWRRELVEREVAPATVEKYLRDAGRFLAFLDEGERPLGKQAVLEYKSALMERYAPASVNSMLAAVNGFLSFVGAPDLRVRQLRVQRAGSRAASRGLEKGDYRRLVQAARTCGDDRATLLVQAICATGMRVSELSFLTVEAARRGFAEVTNKGKTRRVWISERLSKMLLAHARRRRLRRGPVFVTRTGRPIDRTRVWRILKTCGFMAGIDAQKVFPHALRHLFATTFWRRYRDMDALSMLLGHSRMETTRIYLGFDEEKYRKQVADLGLLLF